MSVQRAQPAQCPVSTVRSAANILANPYEALRAMEQTFGPVVQLGRGRFSVYLLFSQAANRYVLTKRPDGFLWRDGVRSIVPITGDRAFGVCDGYEHRRYRSAVEPAFTRARIEGSHEKILAEVRAVIATWTPDGEVDLHTEFERIVRRAVLTALFSTDLSCHSESIGRHLKRAFKYMNSMKNLFQWEIPGTQYARVVADRKAADAIVYDVIARRRCTGPLNPEQPDVIDHLLSPGAGGSLGPFSDEEIRDQVFELIAAGQETTSAALSWMFHLLHLHPETYARAAAEAAELDDAGIADPRVWADLRYIRAVMYETLRMYPPVAVAPRRTKHEFTMGQVRIPAGAFIMISQFVSHRMPDKWVEPDRFLPDRWMESPEVGVKSEPYMYFPFGLGARKCIGADLAKRIITVVAAEVLRNVSMDPAFAELAKPKGVVTMVPKGGVVVRINKNRIFRMDESV